MSIIIPKTCPGGLHRLEWILDGEIAICKNGHEGILWVVAEHNRLRCETNPVARNLAKFVAENRIVRQNPTEDQVAVSLQIAENIMARDEIDASTVVQPLSLHTLMKNTEIVSPNQVAAQIMAKAKILAVAAKSTKPKIQKPVVEKLVIKEVLGTASRGQRDNTKYLPEGVICRSHEEYKEWRQTTQMGQREVAKVLLLSRGLISDIDIGRRPYSSFVSYQFSMYMKDKDSQGA